jgi:hypothetical protein
MKHIGPFFTLDVDEIALTSATDRDSVWLAALGRRR